MYRSRATKQGEQPVYGEPTPHQEIAEGDVECCRAEWLDNGIIGEVCVVDANTLEVVEDAQREVITKADLDMVERYEADTGDWFDVEGPIPRECGYCGEVYQFASDHECHGTLAEEKDAENNSLRELDFFAGRE
jgi:hypothetical protein